MSDSLDAPLLNVPEGKESSKSNVPSSRAQERFRAMMNVSPPRPGGRILRSPSFPIPVRYHGYRRYARRKRHVSPSSEDVRSTYFSRLRLQLDESITSLLNPRKLSVSNDFFRIDSVAIDPDQLPSSPVLRTIPEIDTRNNDDDTNENAYVLTSGGGKTSLAKSVFNLANTTVGAGTLALPFFFSQCGWLLGMVILILIAGLSDLSLHLLVDCGLFSEKRTYLNVARHAKGSAGARLVEFTLLLLTFGAMTSYLVIIGDVAHETIEVRIVISLNHIILERKASHFPLY